MSYQSVIKKLNTFASNRNGFTFLLAIFIVTIIGIMLGLTGKSWTMIMKREREKELLFRGSQIKEAIENWYNPKYTVLGVKWQGQPRPLMELKELLLNPSTLGTLRYLPQSYETKLDDNNPRCAPDCAKTKVYQDPVTGKEWTIIRGTLSNGVIMPNPGGGIVGVASKSDQVPIRTDFKDTSLENLPAFTSISSAKYSAWKFIADPNNDHTKIYRAYHEGL